MKFFNIEIKAKTTGKDRIRNILTGLKAEYRGLDHQVDTYFNASKGRLKLREGNIENNLIYYERENLKGPKKSCYDLLKTEPGSIIKDMLSSAIGVFKVVDKKREIYFIDNVKFHIDTVQNLGDFIEIEAPNIKPKRENMYQAAKRGFATATDLADYLVRKGMAFRDAHEVVGQAVRLRFQQRAGFIGIELD